MKLGSLIFGTKEVKTDEYVLLAQTMTEKGMHVEEISAHIHAIDDMLRVQKMQTIIKVMQRTKTGKLRKGSTYYDILENRIDLLMEELKELQ